MRVKVVKEFVDKNTNKLHKVGEEFECDKSRYNEILRVGAYVAPITERKADKAEK